MTEYQGYKAGKVAYGWFVSYSDVHTAGRKWTKPRTLSLFQITFYYPLWTYKIV